MPSFALTPISSFPPPAPEDFPRGIQWQQDGVDLGEPIVGTIVNVTGGLSVTRGTGETENVITLTAG